MAFRTHPSNLSSPWQQSARGGWLRLCIGVLGLIVLTGCAGDPPVKSTARNRTADNPLANTASSGEPRNAKTADSTSPPGANRANCTPKPGKGHVVLVHGTLHSSTLSFNALSPRLVQAGYCTWARDYGVIDPADPLKGRQPVLQSVQEVSRHIDDVLRRTGQSRIDLVGFSQGGLIGFYLLKFSGYANRVNHFVAIAPSVRGTDSKAALRMNASGQCPACADQYIESPLITQLNTGPLTQAGVGYTVISTREDWIVTPPQRQVIDEPGVRNWVMQAIFPDSRVSHVGLMYDNDAIGLVVKALDSAR